MVKVTPRNRASLLWPSLCTAAVAAILVSLGIWQLHRLAWKEKLIAEINSRADATPVALPKLTEWLKLQPDDYNYRHVLAVGTFENDNEVLVFRPSGGRASDGPGYLVLTPLRLATGGILIVNRGFVPLDRKAQDQRRAGLIEGETTSTGLMRPPEARTIFTPADDPATGSYFTRDPVVVAQRFHLSGVAPFILDADDVPVPGDWPRGGVTVRQLPNNHLSYAVTWFSLAFVLLLCFAAFVRQRWSKA
ncbi:MAG: SURF1 family protein [Alphaproteobacteria bacterium]|nr:SURF1 family protein [Alphaproteobacteria bacterium]